MARSSTSASGEGSYLSGGGGRPEERLMSSGRLSHSPRLFSPLASRSSDRRFFRPLDGSLPSFPWLLLPRPVGVNGLSFFVCRGIS